MEYIYLVWGKAIWGKVSLMCDEEKFIFHCIYAQKTTLNLFDSTSSKKPIAHLILVRSIHIHLFLYMIMRNAYKVILCTYSLYANCFPHSEQNFLLAVSLHAKSFWRSTNRDCCECYQLSYPCILRICVRLSWMNMWWDL